MNIVSKSVAVAMSDTILVLIRLGFSVLLLIVGFGCVLVEFREGIKQPKREGLLYAFLMM